MARRVIYEITGGPEVLQVVEVDIPEPAAGQVRVRVKAAGLNPADWKVFSGGPAARFMGAELPAGVGNDFAGVVDALGEGVDSVALGDEVYGGARNLAEADYVVTAAETLSRRPEALSVHQAAGLDVVSRTAWAGVASLGLGPDDVVFVSAAAGGVGVLAAQLALRTGATVVGTASPSNHDFLRSLGVIPVAYGENMVDRLRDAAPAPFTAALDNHGRASIDAALALGIDPSRVNTIADRSAVAEFGITAVGGTAATKVEREQVAELIAAGEVQFPVDSAFPIERVREAYEHLINGHLRGKVVLTME
jgi:NADPH:quinone reductase-like Zn-dependent oxidoreductase